MALWQFIIFTALIAALLCYANVLVQSLRSANARLRRIDEALVSVVHSINASGIRAAEVKPAEPLKTPEPAKDGRSGYLTMRDLRAGSHRGSSQAVRSGRASAFAGGAEAAGAPNTTDSLIDALEPIREPGHSFATRSPGLEVPRVRGERAGSRGMSPSTRHYLPSLEIRNARRSDSEKQDSFRTGSGSWDGAAMRAAGSADSEMRDEPPSITMAAAAASSVKVSSEILDPMEPG